MTKGELLCTIDLILCLNACRNLESSLCLSLFVLEKPSKNPPFIMVRRERFRKRSSLFSTICSGQHDGVGRIGNPSRGAKCHSALRSFHLLIDQYTFFNDHNNSLRPQRLLGHWIKFPLKCSKGRRPGCVSPLLDLRTGFHADLAARENVFLSGLQRVCYRLAHLRQSVQH
jgi:hypothetical protein